MSQFNGSYTLDTAHSTVGFVARHAMVTKVRGEFRDFAASVELSDDSFKASAAIKTTSVDTGNEDRDNHVRGEDFFNVEQFPEMTFQSTNIEWKGDDKAVVTGELTIKETTKTVSLDVEIDGIAEDPFGNTRVGFEATTTINRTDFGIDFNAPLNTGGVLISEKINIVIDGSAIKNA